MANPFVASFDSKCDGCFKFVMEGEDELYAHEGSYYCETCARELDIVCTECGGYKKPEFETCWKCKKQDSLEGDGATLESWN